MRETFFDILTQPKPSDILYATVADIIPEIRPCIGFDGGIHHGETVFEHMLLACDMVSVNRPLVRLAALMHDIGKPQAFRNGMFKGHEIQSAEIAEDFMRRSGMFGEGEIRFVTALVRHHMMECGKSRIGRMARKFSELAADGVGWRDFVRLRVADKRANRRKGWKPDEVVARIRPLVVRIREALVWTPPTLPPAAEVTGWEVMEILGVRPGPEVGMAIREIANLDRESALARLAEVAERRNNLKEGLRP